jgi:hypothetical protein
MAESQIKLNEEREALAQKFGELRPELGVWCNKWNAHFQAALR